MNKMTNEELLAEFPFLKLDANNPEYLNPYTETWMTGMPEGWYDLLIEMFREIKQVLIENNFLDDYRIDQLKEKFGAIRLYDNTTLTHDIINKYEEMSGKICYVCGKPATVTTRGWIMHMCDNCYDEYERRYCNENPVQEIN